MMLKYYSKSKNKYFRIPLWSIICFFIVYPMLFYWLGIFKEKPIIKNNPKKEIVINECLHDDNYLKFSDENFKTFLKEINIKFPEIVYAQAYLETNGFRSELFHHNNNLFGMKIPSQRSYLSDCDTCKYSFYKDSKLAGWQISIIDYALWQCRYAKYTNREEYIEYLGKHYAEDPEYINKINNLIID